MSQPLPLDVAIFGGGVAGLWLLDRLTAAGSSAVLLEAHALGTGQTIASQGILHGGVKYALAGLVTASARSVSSMPERWRRALAGEIDPDLSRVRRRAEFCHLWQTSSLTSRLGMIGARASLAVRPSAVEAGALPPALASCPGSVVRLDEQVIDTQSLVTVLGDRHARRILRIEPRSGLELECAVPGRVGRIRLLDPETGAPLDLAPDRIVLCAGAGNDALRQACGLEAGRMQRRPLHMVLVRGPDLPMINGHCVDGAHTRVTITSARDVAERVVWQVGGAVAERGISLDSADLLRHARAELETVLPGVDFTGVEWSTYRVDRAEAAAGGRRPSDAFVRLDEHVLTAWPTKLVLAPRLSDLALDLLPEPRGHVDPVPTVDGWTRPTIALLPWEEDRQWRHDL